MSSVIQSKKEQTVQTSEIFGTIQNSTEEVRNHVSLFIDYIHGLTDANREIVQSVSTISATTHFSGNLLLLSSFNDSYCSHKLIIVLNSMNNKIYTIFLTN